MPELTHRKPTVPSVLSRMLYYISVQTEPMPDLSEGSCVGSPEAENWHADMHRESELRKQAKAVCDGCPVKIACGDFALLDPSLMGTWGGMTEHERMLIRRGIGA